jgi:hypothetical protein
MNEVNQLNETNPLNQAGRVHRFKEVKAIGSGRQLFIDHQLIANTEGIALTANPPHKKGPVVLQDRPWRSKLSGYYGTVLEDEGIYKMWTNCGEGDVGSEGSYGINYGKNRYVQYLTSTDGLHWESPPLGVVDFRGSRRNNLVSADDNMEGTIFIDPAAQPEQRFKYLRYMNHTGLHVSHSPDGVHWSGNTEKLLHYMFDSQNVAFRDARLNKYVIYLRGWEAERLDPAGGAVLSPMARNVVRVELDDLRELTRLQGDMPFDTPGSKPPKFTDRLPAVIRCDELDPPYTDVYTNGIVQYPLANDVYLAFPALYSKFKPNEVSTNDGVLGVQLAVSRDGIGWNRIRSPDVRTGPVGEIDSASTYMYTGMLIRETEILQYYWGSSYTHGGLDTYSGWKGTNANAVFAVSQRIDGFMSADAAYNGGVLVTKPFTFTGETLILNLDTSSIGSAAVAITDSDGNGLEGYSIVDCDPIKGNFINKTVSWNGNRDVRALQGAVVRLRFEMRDTKLYSFRFNE